MPPADMLQEGIRLHTAGCLAEAEACYRDVLAARPHDADALHLMGVLAHQRGDQEAAGCWIEAAIGLQPLAASFHLNLGNVRQAQGRLEDAVASYRRAIELQADFFWAYNNLGNALSKLERPDEAVACFERALELQAGDAGTLTNLGSALRATGRLDGAVAAYQRALEADNRFVEAWFNIGNALYDMGDLAAAEEAYRATATLDPNYRSLHWNRSLVHLAAGWLDTGWALYEQRWVRPEIGKPRPLGVPRWQGELLAGRRISIWGEQGVGDEILFASCVPDVVAAAGRCRLECDPRLVSLFARSFPGAEVYPRANPPAIELTDSDWECPLGSLPRFLRPDRESFPASRPLLVADSGRVDFWRQRLAAMGPGAKVGISWRSGQRCKRRDRHYMTVQEMAPLLMLPGLSFVNLQYDDCGAELDWVRRELGVTVHTWPDLDLRDDFEGVAALMTHLDCVVTAGNAVSALAGGLGVTTHCFEVWPESVASLGGERSPWFPSLAYFYRRWNEDWSGVVAAIADILRPARGER